MALLYPILDRVREYLQPAVPGDVLIGVVPEAVDTSAAGVVVAVMGSIGFSEGQAHGNWTSTFSGVIQYATVEITLEVYVAFGNNLPADAVRQADQVAEVIRGALEGKTCDGACGPLELRIYLQPREQRGAGIVFEQTWTCSRLEA